MKRATITETKNGLSALLDQVKAGETILITDRGVPVAQLVPATRTTSDDDEGRIARLERAGLLTRGTGDIRRILDRPLINTIDGSSVVDIVLEERESGW